MGAFILYVFIMAPGAEVAIGQEVARYETAVQCEADLPKYTAQKIDAMCETELPKYAD